MCLAPPPLSQAIVSAKLDGQLQKQPRPEIIDFCFASHHRAMLMPPLLASAFMFFAMCVGQVVVPYLLISLRHLCITLIR